MLVSFLDSILLEFIFLKQPIIPVGTVCLYGYSESN